MSGLPIVTRYRDRSDRIAKIKRYGLGQPTRLTVSENFYSICEAVLTVLHIIQKYEDVRLRDFVKISKPREVIRLMNGNGLHLTAGRLS